MPRLKRTTTEVQEVETPQQDTPPTPADIDIWDHLERLKDNEFVDGSRTVRMFYVYQDAPPITKREGESAYMKIFSERFGPEQLRALNPLASRWKIIEKIVGDNTIRRQWFVAMVPQQPGAPGSMPMAGAPASEMSTAFQEVVKLAKDKDSVQRQAMETSVEIMGSSYKKAIELIPQQGSFADEMTKLKNAGLLNTGGSSFNMESLKGLLEWGIPMLKDSGILQKPTAQDPKKDLDRALDLLEAIETRFGKHSKGSDSIWALTLQTFGPTLARSLETISTNVADIFRARAAMAGVNVQPAARAAAQQPAAGQPSTETGATQPQPAGVMSPQDYVKLRLVALCQQELLDDSPDAESIVNWIHMTAPQLAELLANADEAAVMQMLTLDPVLSQIGATSKATAFKKAIFDELKKDAKAEAVA